jgi:nucleotide-binding universal stress UspA family protein
MYERILVALDASPADEAIIEHVAELAHVHGAHVVLLRVAHSHTRDGLAHEVAESEEYVRRIAEKLTARGVPAEADVVQGEPVEEIIREARERGADLIAMSTHGHRKLYDLIFGSVAEEVRHEVSIPVLLVRGRQG